VSAATSRWRLDLAYDGSSFLGFAEQPHVDTVVGALRRALAITLRMSNPPEIVGAGRTDAGVHAYAQVVHADLPSPLYPNDRGDPAARLIKSLNSQLASRVVVRAARVVPNEFHARFSATWRAYRYLVIETSEPALALSSAVAWNVPGPLNIDLMNEAAQLCVGTHDFRSFCRRRAGTTSAQVQLREVTSVNWRRLDDTWQLSPHGASALRLDIRANAFCHQMVRSLTSLMVFIGQAKAPVSLMKERLEHPDRQHLPSPAPPGALALVGVGYPEFAGGPSGFVS
jgi:tRNA pseudouridine38-40 synthase